MRPIRRYVRARLHRRIFMWFGLSIALTIAVVLGLVGLSSQRSPWRDDVARAERFLGHQLARVWTDPIERERLIASMARDLDARIAVYDATGHRVDGADAACKKPVLRIAVPGPGADHTAAVGQVDVCIDRRGPRAWLFLLITAVAGSCLWLASGVIARRLTRPLGRVASVARDIGDGKLDSRVAIGCRHHGDEIGALSRAINDMAARIEKQMADQRALLAAVSHELRTPLGHMRVVIEILRDAVADRAQRDRIDDLEREVLEVDSLVGQLLASSRLSFDTLDRRPLDAADVAARALERAGLPASLLALDTGDCEFEGDATLLARALANLLGNGRSHGQGVAALRVSATAGEAGGALMQFEVLDRGPGFASGEAERVFDQFYRGEHRAGQSSLGLGLALVDRIARAHGGRAFARNRPEGGAGVGFTVARA